jgi:predicted ArsR family transcriptional regulator
MTNTYDNLSRDLKYPMIPGAKTDGPSQDAADHMTPKVDTVRKKVLNCFTQHENLTADEVAQKLQIDRLTIRPRVSELVSMGKLTDTGDRRANSSGRNATVWRKGV